MIVLNAGLVQIGLAVEAVMADVVAGLMLASDEG